MRQLLRTGNALKLVLIVLFTPTIKVQKVLREVEIQNLNIQHKMIYVT